MLIMQYPFYFFLPLSWNPPLFFVSRNPKYTTNSVRSCILDVVLLLLKPAEDPKIPGTRYASLYHVREFA